MDPAKAIAAARNPATTPEELRLLSEFEFMFVREAVAAHPLVTTEILDGLLPVDIGVYEQYCVARSVADSDRTSATTLGAVLALIDARQLDGSRRENWTYEDVAKRALTRARCPIAEAERLLDDSLVGMGVRLYVAKNAHSVDVLSILLRDRSKRVREAAAAQKASILS